MKKLSLIYLISITIIAGVILASSKASADDSVVSQVSISVPTACTMNGSGMNSHTANVNNGTYTPDIGTTTLHAFCNDANGFAIYAIGYTDNEFGKNVLTSSTLGASHDIATGTADSGSTSNWAMKLAKTQDSGDTTSTNAFTLDNGFNSYHAVPAEYTKVAHKNTATDMDSTNGGVKLTTTYAVLISANQAAGTYTGQVKYTLVHPVSELPLQPQTATPGCINYFPNGSDVVGTMGCQSATDNTSVTLLASNFSRTGYGFAGWSDKYDYATNASAHFYGPSETIASPVDTTTNGLPLYAVWVKSAGNLQDATTIAQLCGTDTGSLTTAPTDGTANLSSISALTDQRDNETYAIAKLADGHCWMIENLRLESTNSDNSTGALAQGYGTSSTYGNFEGLANAESANFSNSAIANSLYYSGTQSGSATINIGTINKPAYRMPRYNNWNNQPTSAGRPQNPTTNSVTNSTTNAGMYSYGNYYTWHAAVANLTHNGTTNQSTTGTSLCPAGWHLPTGGSAYANGSTSGVNVTGDTSTFREFYNLGYKTMDEVKTAYEDTPNSGSAYYSSNTTNTAGKTATAAIRSFPNNFLYSGNFDDSSVSNRGSLGAYWSSTANSYYLYLNSSNVSPGTEGANKYNGLSIRCMVGS